MQKLFGGSLKIQNYWDHRSSVLNICFYFIKSPHAVSILAGSTNNLIFGSCHICMGAVCLYVVMRHHRVYVCGYACFFVVLNHVMASSSHQLHMCALQIRQLRYFICVYTCTHVRVFGFFAHIIGLMSCLYHCSVGDMHCWTTLLCSKCVCVACHIIHCFVRCVCVYVHKWDLTFDTCII